MIEMGINTQRLRRGDLVEMLTGGSREIGRHFVIIEAYGTDDVALVYATKAGRPDKRFTPWSGWYGDCTWQVIHQGALP